MFGRAHTTLEVAWKRFQQRRAGESPLTVQELMQQHDAALEASQKYTRELEQERQRVDNMSDEEYRAYALEKQRAAQRAQKAMLPQAGSINFAAVQGPTAPAAVAASAAPPPPAGLTQQVFATLLGWRIAIKPIHMPRQAGTATATAADSSAHSDSDSDSE